MGCSISLKTPSSYQTAKPCQPCRPLPSMPFLSCLPTLITLPAAPAPPPPSPGCSGYLAVFILLCYYSSPLSTLGTVLSTRSSASLYWPLSLMSCVNGSLWVAYGLAVSDGFILYPNLVGAVFGVLQMACIFIFPAK